MFFLYGLIASFGLFGLGGDFAHGGPVAAAPSFHVVTATGSHQRSVLDGQSGGPAYCGTCNSGGGGG